MAPVDNGLLKVCVWQSVLSHLFCGARYGGFCVMCIAHTTHVHVRLITLALFSREHPYVLCCPARALKPMLREIALDLRHIWSHAGQITLLHSW